jgi:hypothetical protein
MLVNYPAGLGVKFLPLQALTLIAGKDNQEAPKARQVRATKKIICARRSLLGVENLLPGELTNRACLKKAKQDAQETFCESLGIAHPVTSMRFYQSCRCGCCDLGSCERWYEGLAVTIQTVHTFGGRGSPLF